MATKKKDADGAERMPRRVPPKLGAQAPESGPSGDLVIDVDAKPPATIAPVIASEKNGILVEATAKERERMAKSNAKTYRVRATKPGFLGNRYIETDTVFDMLWSEKENGRWPSWVVKVADPDATATSSVAHSSEAQEEVVDDEGTGHDAKLEEVL